MPPRTDRSATARSGSATRSSGTAPSGSAAAVKDPFGTIWWVVAQVEDVAEEEMWKRLRMPEYVEAMKVAQETFDAEMTGRGSGRSSAPVRTDG